MDFYDKLIKAILILLIWLLMAIIVVMGTVLVMQGGINEEHQAIAAVHAGRHGV